MDIARGRTWAVAIGGALALAGCGRLDFAPLGGDGGSSSGGSNDGAVGGDGALGGGGGDGGSGTPDVIIYPMDVVPSFGVVVANIAAYDASCVEPHCPTVIAGHIDGAFGFDGTTDVVTLPSSMLVGAGPYSVALWVTSSSGMIGTLVAKPFANNMTNDVLSLWLEASGQPTFETTSTAIGRDEFGADSNVPPIGWHHVAITCTGTSKTIYIDGATDGTEPVTTPLSDSPLAVQLGADLDNGVADLFYAGGMDDVHFYPTRALSAAEVATLAAQ